jgi:hypothetical protein
MASNNNIPRREQPPGIEEVIGFSGRSKASLIPRVVSSPVKTYTSNIGRTRTPSLHWEAPEWDLAECGRIVDTESIVRRAFAVKEALFIKEGWEFIGHEPERVAYIKKRLLQMEHAGGTPFHILMSWTINSLIRTNNAFWVKKRDLKASGGGPREIDNGRTIDPVAAYFPLPAETVRFKRDEYGKIVKYAQEIYGKQRVEFNPEDVVHFFFDKREGFSVGTPNIVPVKDDIRALRRIEENVELLVYSHLFPLYHYKVGTESAPAMIFPDGTTEIQVVEDAVANMPADGCWVTPERHTIEVVGAEGEALKVQEILAYFKNRIYVGLGVSPIDMGEPGSASRSTAQTLSRNLVERTKAEQRTLEAFINKLIIEELLLESSFGDESLFNKDNKVSIKFKEIDNEVRQSLENHASQMYMQNGFTHDEMREYIGREPFTDKDWEKSHWRQIDEPTKLMQSLDEPYSIEAKAVARANTTSIQEPDLKQAQAQKEKERKQELQAKKPQAISTRKSTIKQNKTSANRNQPQNQHGKRSSAKLNKDFYDAYENNPELPSLDVVFAQKPPVRTTFLGLKEDIVQNIRYHGWNADKIKTMLGVGLSHAKDMLIAHSKKAYRIGINDTGVNYLNIRLSITDSKIEKHITRYVNKLQEDTFNNIKRRMIRTDELNNEDATVAGLIIDALVHRAKMIDDNEVKRAYNAGKADGYKLQGEEIVIFRHNNSLCSICNNKTLRWKTSDAIIYEDLPPLHPGCTCVLTKAQK